MTNTYQNNIIHRFLTEKSFRFWRHLALVTSIGIVTLSFVWYIPLTEVTEYYRFYAWAGYFLVLGAIIYTNIYASVPRLLLKGKLVKYIVSLFVFVIGIILNILILQVFLLKKVPQEELNLVSFLFNISSACFILVFLLLGTSSIVLIKYWILADMKRAQLETSILESELKLLKNQVNPHFLFNMLNNANMLLKKDKEQASKVLFKLEDLLRYQINDSNREEVLLSSEIQFLNDYLNLEKIRRDHFTYTIETTRDIETIKVAPLLFIIFTENAVKHNPENESLSYVNIEFSIDGNNLHFICENSKPDYPDQSSAAGGLGLKNIRRRLNLLYPDRHSLDVTDEKTRYIIDLNLML